MPNPDWPELDPDDYADVEIDDPDNPEWTDEDFAKARPLSELLPNLHAKLTSGEPIVAVPVRTVTLDLDAAVVEAFQSKGPDWRERMRGALAREAERVKEEA